MNHEDDRITELQRALRIAENRIALLERALRELAAIVSQDAWEGVLCILTGGEEGGDE